MSSDKQRRLATAVGFLAGLLACLGIMRDRKVFWPPDVVWRSLPGPQQLELAGGLALVVVTLVVWVVQQKRVENRRP